MVSRKTQEKGQNFLDPTKQNLRSYKRKLERLKTKGRERRGEEEEVVKHIEGPIYRIKKEEK
jgi:hypothetical protein